MNLPRHSFSWSLSLAFHLAAAVLLGWFAGAAVLRPAPASPALAAVAISFADTAVDTASGAEPGGVRAAAETPPVPRSEAPPAPAETRIPLPAPDLTVASASDASIALPRSETRPQEATRAEYGTDVKASFFSDLDAAIAPDGGTSAAHDGGSGSGDGTSTGSGHGDGRPATLASIAPVYPVGARRRGEEGRVVIEATVMANGRAGACLVAESSGSSELDRAAKNAIRRARFTPATRQRVRVPSRIRLTFIFNLRD
jgi:protein TonB